MKRLVIVCLILLIYSCKDKMSGLVEVTNSKKEFKIGVPQELRFDTITHTDKFVVRFNENSLYFEINGFNHKPEFEQEFRDTLVDFNEKNLLLRTESDYYSKNGFKIHKQYAVGLDTLTHTKFSRVDYWLNKKKDNYFITFTAERKDSLFSDKEFDLIDDVLNSIER